MFLRMRWAIVDFFGGSRGRFVSYVGFLTVLIASAIWGGKGLVDLVLHGADGIVRDRSETHPQGSVSLTQDAWHERIRTNGFWNDRGSSSRGGSSSGNGNAPITRSERSGLFGIFSDDDDDRYYRRRDGESGTYRTVCVRLCDGSFFPISASTTPGHFAQDESTCARSCKTPARLFVYDSRDGQPEDMRDTNGQPYSKLPNANAFRTTYNPSCTCGPQPWEQGAKDLHAMYALEQAVQKGDKSAIPQLQALKAKIAAENPQKLATPARQPDQSHRWSRSSYDDDDDDDDRRRSRYWDRRQGDGERWRTRRSRD